MRDERPTLARIREHFEFECEVADAFERAISHGYHAAIEDVIADLRAAGNTERADEYEKLMEELPE